jgi:hypothetical protein
MYYGDMKGHGRDVYRVPEGIKNHEDARHESRSPMKVSDPRPR